MSRLSKRQVSGLTLEEKLNLTRRRKYLDILVDDPSSDVRLEVAKHGYGLEKLVDDPDSDVRREVAKFGYGLDILVCDPWWRVRREVAKHGHRLEILINDMDDDVRLEAAESLDIPKVYNCGNHNRMIYINPSIPDIINIGCFKGTREEAIVSINEKYNGSNALEYISKVEECFRLMGEYSKRWLKIIKNL